MTLKESLSRARKVLVARDIDCAPLESELLLRQALELGRVQLYQSLEQGLAPEQEETFWRLVERRLKGEPTAYITGHREFYGFDFLVSPSVLIPRPESELLVERALNLAQEYRAPVIADIATGCGAIAISLALVLPQARLYASDISAPALEVALANCRRHGVASRVCLLHGDMLEPLPEPVDFIVANLPYVKHSELKAGGFEPVLALNGGRDGLEKIRHLCHQVSNRLHPGGCLLLEIGQGQRRAVTTLLGSFLPAAEIEVTPDLGGIDRVLSAILPPVVKT
ncbi:MAG: peptide chain release factor N(5)-glutamine methyltransferase [Dehalococcoidales bacterium]